MSNELVFAERYLETFKRYSELEQTIKELTKTQKDVRIELLNAMRDYNIVSVDNDFIQLSRVAPSYSTTINTERLRLQEPDIYDELIEKYPKTTEKAEHIRVKVK